MPLESQVILDDQESAAPVWLNWLLLLGSVGILTVAFFLQPADGNALRFSGMNLALPEICMVKRVFGWNCPGCGLTRSVSSTCHGRLLQAITLNPAGPMFFLIFVFQIPYRLYVLGRGWRRSDDSERGSPQRVPRVPGGVFFIVLTFVVMVVQWLLRPFWA